LHNALIGGFGLARAFCAAVPIRRDYVNIVLNGKVYFLLYSQGTSIADRT